MNEEIEKTECHCPECGRFLFSLSGDGEAFYFRRGVKYVIQSAKCCGIVVTGIEARYNTPETQISGPMADATSNPKRAVE